MRHILMSTVRPATSLSATCLFILLVAIAGCGSGSDPDAANDPVVLQIDSSVVIEPTAAITGSWHPEPWRVTRQEGKIRITANPIVGDEASERYTLVFQDTAEPIFLSGSYSASSWDGENTIESSQSIAASRIQLSSWNPDGLTAGRVVAATGAEDEADTDEFGGEFDFWADVSLPLMTPRSGDTAVLGIGQVAEFEGHWFQISRIVENSLCPPDVECVWEGRLAYELEDRYWAEPRTFRLTGWQDDQGRTLGGSEPSVTLPDEEWIRITVVGFSADPGPTFRVLFEEVVR